MPDRLAIYRLAAESADAVRLTDLAARIFDLRDDYHFTETPDNRSLRNGHRLVDLAKASGAVWAADESQLWRPAAKPALLKDNEAVARGTEFLRARKLLPVLAQPFRYGS